MSKDSEDKVLISKINIRDETAMEVIFIRFYPGLCYFAYRITNDRDSARDIVQEIFIKLFEARKYKFENIYALKSFLYRSVRNSSIDYIRGRDKARKAISESESDEQTHEMDIEIFELESQVYQKLHEAIERLPQRCRQIFEMSYTDQLSTKDIARTLGIAETTVKTQKQRAIKYLKERLRNK